MTDRYRENTVLKNKSKLQQQTFSDTQPNKTGKQKQNKMANKQVNQTIQSDIRPFQSDIKFLFLIPFNPTGLIKKVHLPLFSVNQKVLVGSSLWLVSKVRVHSETMTRTGLGGQ